MYSWKQRTSGDRSPILGGDPYEGWTLEQRLNEYTKLKSRNSELGAELALCKVEQKVLTHRLFDILFASAGPGYFSVLRR